VRELLGRHAPRVEPALHGVDADVEERLEVGGGLDDGRRRVSILNLRAL